MEKMLEVEYGGKLVTIFKVVTQVPTISGGYVMEEHVGRVHPSHRDASDVRGGALSAEELLQRLKAGIEAGHF